MDPTGGSEQAQSRSRNTQPVQTTARRSSHTALTSSCASYHDQKKCTRPRVSPGSSAEELGASRTEYITSCPLSKPSGHHANWMHRCKFTLTGVISFRRVTGNSPEAHLNNWRLCLRPSKSDVDIWLRSTQVPEKGKSPTKEHTGPLAL